MCVRHGVERVAALLPAGAAAHLSARAPSAPSSASARASRTAARSSTSARPGRGRASSWRSRRPSSACALARPARAARRHVARARRLAPHGACSPASSSTPIRPRSSLHPIALRRLVRALRDVAEPAAGRASSTAVTCSTPRVGRATRLVPAVLDRVPRSGSGCAAGRAGSCGRSSSPCSRARPSADRRRSRGRSDPARGGSARSRPA